MYLPFAYASTVKHPRQRFVWRSVIQEDGMFWLLATVFVSPQPFWHVVATALFLVSFWCVYELGYIENDYAAANFEGDQGRVPEAYTGQQPQTGWAWLWAITLGAAGSGLLSTSGVVATGLVPWLIQVLVWVVVLIATRAIFALYNRISVGSRCLLYPLLQGFRSFSVLAFAATNMVGVMVLVAHTLARVFPYFLYRLAGSADGRFRQQWPAVPVFLIRLVMFGLLVLAVAVGQGDATMLLQTQTWAILVWCLYRSRKELVAVLRGIELLGR